MINNKKVLAVIPARGGSKRLPRKNILPLGGRPLICWTILAALGCKYIDRIIVSTDDDEIADVSRKSGADVPFLRPDELAVDDASTIDVVMHLLNELEKKENDYHYIVLLQPTSALRTSGHITEAFDELVGKSQSAIVSVCLAEHHPFWSNKLSETQSMSAFLQKDMHNIRSQDLPNYYRLNGAIYICDVGLLKSEQSFLPSQSCSAYIMSQEDSVDIDTKNDFDRAQLIVDRNIIKKSQLVDQLLSDYMRQGFGELSKIDVDMLMFDFLIKRHCLLHNNEVIVNGEVDYIRIDKRVVTELSVELQISEEKVLDYINNLAALKGSQKQEKMPNTG